MKLRIGPASLITAAFLGPGTLATCTVAGATFDYQLIWVLGLATFTTIILQEMALRLGLASRQGLGEALRHQLPPPYLKILGISLVFTSIILGNAAYEMGNIMGAVLALESSHYDHQTWIPLILGVIVFLLLWTDNFNRIKLALSIMVGTMGIVFLTTALLVPHDSIQIVAGLTPSIHRENSFMVLALIGTTVVPYNLFLHASAAAKINKGISVLYGIRWDSAITIGIGGLISMAVLLSAAAMPGNTIENITDMAVALEPTLGSAARPLLATGLFAAGISSAITAPLAAAYTARGIFGWHQTSDTWKIKGIWMVVLFSGVVFSLIGLRPIFAIQVAQVANAILLPVIVVFLITMCNRKNLMQGHANTAWQNIMALAVLLIALVISFRGLNAVFGLV